MDRVYQQEPMLGASSESLHDERGISRAHKSVRIKYNFKKINFSKHTYFRIFTPSSNFPQGASNL